MKVSIITVTLNAGGTIGQTLESVGGQTYPHIEHIIIDGGSTDGTVRTIREHEQHLAYWVSEPDEGISSAMNKGLAKATGSYVLFLNADDYLLDPVSIETLVPDLTADIVGAPLVKLEPGGGERTVRPRGFNFWFNFKNGFFHQSTLCALPVIRKLGGFPEDLKLAMDYELFLRAYRCSCSFRRLSKPFSVMRSGGVSTRNDHRSVKVRLDEEKRIHFRNSTGRAMNGIYLVYWMLYPSYRLRRTI